MLALVSMRPGRRGLLEREHGGYDVGDHDRDRVDRLNLPRPCGVGHVARVGDHMDRPTGQHDGHKQ